MLLLDSFTFVYDSAKWRLLFIMFLMVSPAKPHEKDFWEHIQRMPTTEMWLRKQFETNNLVGEAVGYVLSLGSPSCGHIQINFERWINGTVFDEYFKKLTATMEGLNEDRAESYEIYKLAYDSAKANFILEVEAMLKVYEFDDREQLHNLHRGGRHTRAAPLIVFAGLGFATWLGADVIKSWFSTSRQESILESVKKDMEVVSDSNEHLHRKLLRYKFNSILNTESMHLRMMFREALQKMMEENRFVGDLLHDDGTGILDSIKNIMGGSYDDSLLKLYKGRAASMVSVSVLSLQGPEASVRICVPDTTTTDLMELVRVIPSGTFDKHQEFFTMHKLPEFYGIRSNGSIDNAVIVDLGKCKHIGVVHLCETLTMQAPDCQLSSEKRTGCDMEVIPSKERHFTYIRSLVTAVVVATKEDTADFYMNASDKQHYDRIELKNSVAIIVLPNNTCMNIGGKLFYSRIQSSEFSLTYPQKAMTVTDNDLDGSADHVRWKKADDSANMNLKLTFGLIFFVAILIILIISLFAYQTYYLKMYAKKKDTQSHVRNQVAQEASYDMVPPKSDTNI